MQLLRQPGRALGTLLTLAMTGLAACADKSAGVDEKDLPNEPNIAPNVRAAAFIFDVDRASGKVRVIAPSGGAVSAVRTAGGPSLSLMGGNGRPMSILAGDVIDITTENFTASGVGTGGAEAGRVFVSFDVRITNRLNGVRLVRPTFPAPPAGLLAGQQVLLFPFAASTVVTQGGTSTTGAGDEVIVEAPSRGAVEAALSVGGGRDAFDGPAHNFFDDTLGTCAAGNPNCFLYEAYPTIGASENSPFRRVGFMIDPTVNRFRARLLIAANLENAVATFGTVSGVVQSPVAGIGPVAGVTVSVGGQTAVTNASGQYTIASVPTGNQTVSITSALPAGCTATPQLTTVVQDPAATTVNFSLAGCVAPTGVVSGQINSSLGGALSGVGVVLTPTGGSAQPTVFTSAAGAFTATVPAPLSGTSGGRITGFTNVPGNCTAPAVGAGLFTYAGLANGGSASIPAITFTCTPPAIIYPFGVVAQASTRAGAPATERELVLSLDLTQNRPDNNGAGPDQVAGITIQFGFGATVTPVTAAGDAVSLGASFGGFTPFWNPSTIAGSQATLGLANFTGDFTGNLAQFVRVRFNAPSGATINVWVTEAVNSAAFDLLPWLRGPSPANALVTPAAPLVVTIP